MSDLAQLESEILTQVAAADNEAALEAVRVAALGRGHLGQDRADLKAEEVANLERKTR